MAGSSRPAFTTAVLSACRPVPVERTDGAGRHDQHRLPGPATSSAAPGSLVRRGPAALPAPQVAFGRFPWRGKDLAWPRTRRPAWNLQHEDPSLPDRRGNQPEAARRSPFCAHSDLCRASRPSPEHPGGERRLTTARGAIVPLVPRPSSAGVRQAVLQQPPRTSPAISPNGSTAGASSISGAHRITPLVRRGSPRRVAGEPLLARLKEVL